MKKIHLLFSGILIGLAAVCPARGQSLSIDVGTHIVQQGVTSAIIPIAVTGGLDITDMTGVVAIGDGGPLVGGTPGPVIKSISYTGSIWENAPGGFSPLSTIALPEQIFDPNVSLIEGGESVSGAGPLFELTVDVSGFAPGDYALALSNPSAGATEFFDGGAPVSAALTNGVIRIVTVKNFWRRENFPDAIDNPFEESTVWGDSADPEDDGLSNRVEFGAGTDPNASAQPQASAAGGGVPVVTIEEDGGERYLTIRFTRRIDAPGLTVTVEVSTNLADWDATEMDIEQVGGAVPTADGITELVTKRYSTPLSGVATPLFLRVTYGGG